MPSTYAHYRFGQEVYKMLSDNSKKVVEPYKELYDIGLHGPDILFYYKPLTANRVNQIGFGMHEKPGYQFFSQAGSILLSRQEAAPYYSYIYGFICHFVLDSECHGYIDKKIEESKVSHTEIEVEFDRALMCKDGYNPVTHRLTEHICPSEANSHIIASFFEGITGVEVQMALESMKAYNNLLIAPHRAKRLLIYAMLLFSGNYKEMHGLLVNYKENSRCYDSTKRLKTLYDNALFSAVRLIHEYEDCIYGKKSFDTRYRLTFGSKEME